MGWLLVHGLGERVDDPRNSRCQVLPLVKVEDLTPSLKSSFSDDRVFLGKFNSDHSTILFSRHYWRQSKPSTTVRLHGLGG